MSATCACVLLSCLVGGNGDSTNLRSRCVKRRGRDGFWQGTGEDISVRWYEHDSGEEREHLRLEK